MLELNEEDGKEMESENLEVQEVELATSELWKRIDSGSRVPRLERQFSDLKTENLSEFYRIF